MIVFELVLFSGKLNEEYLREMLMTTGDRYSEEQVDELLREAPIDANGDFDYIEVDQATIFQFSTHFFSL
jgi:Ca2+-binding EF-hand superfamily protein